MVLVEDDTILHPEIDADSLLYISALSEDYTNYTRFFDALLIKRTQHRSFFRDLRSFRQQPHIIVLLDQARADKTKYKNVTVDFLGSRFAHPWCRRSGLKKGFWRAEWGSIDGKKKDAETDQEEQKLHKLLVPLWVIMRSKMFPGEEIVRNWCNEERSRVKEYGTRGADTTTLDQKNVESKTNTIQHDDCESEDDEQSTDAEDFANKDSQAAAHAATSVFRLAAAGVILSQTPKRKLRWLVKKS